MGRLGRSWCLGLGLPAIEPREMGGFVAAADQLQEAVFEFFASSDLVHRAGRSHQTIVDYCHVRAHLFDQCHHV